MPIRNSPRRPPGSTKELSLRLDLGELMPEFEQLAARNYRSLSGEAMAALTAWIEQHRQATSPAA